MEIGLLKFVNHSHNFTLPPRNFFHTWASGGLSYTSYSFDVFSDSRSAVNITQRKVFLIPSNLAEQWSISKLSAKLLTLAVCWSAFSLKKVLLVKQPYSSLLDVNVISSSNDQVPIWLPSHHVCPNEKHLHGQFTSYCQLVGWRWQSVIWDGPLWSELHLTDSGFLRLNAVASRSFRLII